MNVDGLLRQDIRPTEQKEVVWVCKVLSNELMGYVYETK